MYTLSTFSKFTYLNPSMPFTFVLESIFASFAYLHAFVEG